MDKLPPILTPATEVISEAVYNERMARLALWDGELISCPLSAEEMREMLLYVAKHRSLTPPEKAAVTKRSNSTKEGKKPVETLSLEDL